MRKIIINADDFGIHQAVNRGIIYGHTCGHISSTTIMAVGRAFSEAAALAYDNPKLGVGIHLTLVGEQPVAEPHAIPSLVDGEGNLPALYPQFLKQLIQGRISLYDVRTELEAQIKKVLSAGIQPTHLDSHQHMHVVPGVIDIVLDLASQYSIKAVRIPDEPILFFGGYRSSPGRFIGRGGLSVLASFARRKARRQKLAAPDHFYGMLAGGFMTENRLLAIIDRLPPGISEIMMHPGDSDGEMTHSYGWQYSWQAELAAVTGEKLGHRLSEQGIEAISFRELAHE